MQPQVQGELALSPLQGPDVFEPIIGISCNLPVIGLNMSMECNFVQQDPWDSLEGGVSRKTSSLLTRDKRKRRTLSSSSEIVVSGCLT